MTLGSTADIDFMLREAGVAVTYGTTSGFGIFDQTDELQPSDLGGVVQSRATTLLVRTGVFPELKIGKTIVAGGANYRIDRFNPEDDSQLTRLYLAVIT